MHLTPILYFSYSFFFTTSAKKRVVKVPINGLKCFTTERLKEPGSSCLKQECDVHPGTRSRSFGKDKVTEFGLVQERA